jgi:hypothetical protein
LEVGVKVDGEEGFALLFIDLEAAHELLDDPAAEAIFWGQDEAVGDRKAMSFEASAVGFELFMILKVGLLDEADRTHAEADHVFCEVEGVALEVAIELAGAVAEGERVRVEGKVIHTDGRIASLNEKLAGLCVDGKLLFCGREGVLWNGVLMLFEPRNFGVGKESYAVGLPRRDDINRMRKTRERLKREPVNEIDIDAVERKLARHLERCAAHLFRLTALDGLLDFRIEILNAKADPVKAETLESFEFFSLIGINRTRVDFNGKFGIGFERKRAVERREKQIEFRDRERGGRTAAEMKLRDRSVDKLGDERDLVKKPI